MPNATKTGRRRDAVANREKLITAAEEVFASAGVNAPLESVARVAGVSIGTLYNNFATRGVLLDAVYPPKIAAMDAEAAAAAEDPDAWHGFRSFLVHTFERQAADRGLNDAMTARYPDATALTAACEASLERIAGMIKRAQTAGVLRADYAMQDLAFLIWSTSRVIAATAGTAPEAWRRFLDLQLDGLRAEAAHPLSVPPMTPDQVADAMRVR